MKLFLLLSALILSGFAQTEDELSEKSGDKLIVEHLVLELKSPLEIPINPKASIFIKDRIVKVKPSGLKTIIMGNAKGFTYLQSGLKKFNIQVLDSLDWKSYSEFNDIFKEHPSIKIIFDDNGPSLYGEILIPTDLVLVLDWLEKSSLKPKLKIQFYDEDIKKFAIDTLSEKFGIQVKNIDENMNLHLNKQADKTETEKINKLGFSFSSAASNGLELGNLEIQFVNITDSELKNMSPILPTEFQWTVNEKIKLISQIFNSNYSDLKSLNKRSTDINLMLFENEAAVYHSGGEFAIEQRSVYSNNIQWKTYGLFVDALPISINENEIKLNIKVKMSYMISSDLNQPSLSQDSWQQNLRLEKNKTLVVSNSITNMFNRDRRNHLFLKSVPILGALFKGTNSGKEKSNIYMLIKLNPVIKN